MTLVCRSLVLVGLLLACASFSFGDQVTVTLTGASNYVSPDGGYIAPYYLQVQGSTSSFAVICDDYTVDVEPGDTWTAQTFSLSNLGTTGDSARFVGSGSFANTTSYTIAYEEAAWLAYQTGLFGGSATPTNQQISNLNYALWYLFDPSLAHGLSTDPGYVNNVAAINTLLGQAYAAVTGSGPLPSYFSNMVIYTPTCNGQTPCTASTAPPNSQEYITFTTPEPSSLAFLGAGIVGFASRKRFFKRS